MRRCFHILNMILKKNPRYNAQIVRKKGHMYLNKHKHMSIFFTIHVDGQSIRIYIINDISTQITYYVNSLWSIVDITLRDGFIE